MAVPRSDAEEAGRTHRPPTSAVVTLAIVALFAILAGLRQLTANVEIDEAHFFDQLTFALGYDGSQPPLYTWLVLLVYQATGGDFVLALSMVKAALNALAWVLMYRLVRNTTGQDGPALIALATLMLMPQVIWQMQITLSHSVLVHTAAVATLYASERALRTGSWLSYTLLGLAIAAGVLAKYNFFAFLAALAVAAASLSSIRRQISALKLAAAIGLAVALVAPHAAWALANAATSTERLARVFAKPAAFDLPYVGIDGFAWLMYALVLSTFPIWIAAGVGFRRLRARADATRSAPDAELIAFRTLLGRTLIVGLVGTAVAVLALDVHVIDSRYLIPLLAPLPAWLALMIITTCRPEAWRFAQWIALGLGLILPVVFALKITSGSDRLSLPFAALAREATAAFGADAGAVLSRREVTGVNLALQYGGRAVPEGQSASTEPSTLGSGPVLVVANLRRDGPWLAAASEALQACGWQERQLSVRVEQPHGLVLARRTPMSVLAFDRPDAGVRLARCAPLSRLPRHLIRLLGSAAAER